MLENLVEIPNSDGIYINKYDGRYLMMDSEGSLIEADILEIITDDEEVDA